MLAITEECLLFIAWIGDFFFCHDIEAWIFFLFCMFAELLYKSFVDCDIIFARIFEFFQVCQTLCMGNQIPQVK